LLGMAYKRDISDVRESPALDVLRLLEADGAEVTYHDPYVAELDDEGHKLSSVELTDAALDAADAVVILTDHTAFDYDWIHEHARVLIDGRHAVTRLSGDAGTGWIVKS